MRCIHCGNEIGDDYRFCSFCGGENLPAAPVRPEAQPYQPVQPRQPERRPQPRKGDAMKWVIGGLWLAVVLVAWVVTLLLTTGGAGEATANKPNEENSSGWLVDSSAALTDGDWYCWDRERGVLNRWRFDEDGTACYGPVDEEHEYTVSYTIGEDSNTVMIGYSEEGLYWEYDPAEHCFWQYREEGTQVYKTRIFALKEGTPPGGLLCYSYRTDNGYAYFPVSYEKFTVMDASVADELIRRYNTYVNFLCCADWDTPVSEEEKLEVMRQTEYAPEYYDIYSVHRLSCCHSFGEMYWHLCNYMDSKMVSSSGADFVQMAQQFEGLVEYNGYVYCVYGPMGYYGCYAEGDPVDDGNGQWSVAARYDFEEDPYTVYFARVDGTIKLTGVTRGAPGAAVGTAAALDEETAWELIDLAHCSNILWMVAENGTDETDVYTIYPFTDNPNFAVTCPSVQGIDDEDDMRRVLEKYFTDPFTQWTIQSYRISREEADLGCEGWFSHNGTIYFVPNYGRGDPMLYRDTMTISQTGENTWTVSALEEFTDVWCSYHIVFEDGTYKVDGLG